MRIPSAHTSVGKALRLPLRLLPEGMPVRVLSGPSRGARWFAGSGLHSYWIGVFEPYASKRFAAACSPGATVIDVGANVGFYTVIAAKRVGPSGRVIAFEPWPRSLFWLQRHVAENNLENTTIFAQAVAEGPGVDHIHTPTTDNAAQLGGKGIAVELTSLDSLGVHPNVIKIDAEGAEARILRGADRTIAEARPVIFLSVHSISLEKECFSFLHARGYVHETLVRDHVPGVYYDGSFIFSPA